MNEEPIESQIQSLKDAQARQIRELRRLQNENGARHEELARLGEQCSSLEAELAEREHEYNLLEEEIERKKEENRRTTNQKFDGKNRNTSTDELTIPKIIEKFNSLLIKKNKEIDRALREQINYYQKQQKTHFEADENARRIKLLEAIEEEEGEDADNDKYAQCNITAVRIQRVREDDDDNNAGNKDADGEMEESHRRKRPNSTSFIISEETTFADLFVEACNFWGVGDAKDYELLDETESALCDQDQKVELHFKTRLGNMNQYQLYLRKKTNQSVPTQPQKEAIKVDSGITESKGSDPNFNREVQEKIDHYREFFNRFVGLKPFIDVEKVKQDERKKPANEEPAVKPLRIDDNHCFITTAVFFLMIFTMAPYNQEGGFLNIYYTIAGIQKDFGVENEIFSLASQNGTYQNISLKSDFYRFLNLTVSASLFFKNPANPAPEHHELLAQNFLIGTVRIRQMRVTTDVCSNIPAEIISIIPCYYSIYTEAVRSESAIDLTAVAAPFPWAGTWGTFKTAEQLGQKAGLSGLLSSYDGSGYVVDVPKNISKNDFRNFTGYLQSSVFINLSTRATALSFLLYNQGGELFIYCELLIEKSANGLMIPNNMTIIPFRRTMRDSSTLRPNHAAYDVLRLICAVILNIFVLYRVINRCKFDFRYIVSYKGALNILLFVLSYMSVASNVSLGADSIAQMSMSDVLDSAVYIDMKHLADGYMRSMTIMGILGALSIARFSAILGAIPRFKLIMMSLETAAQQILMYALILIPLMIGFTIAAGNLFGVHSGSFNNFRDAFVSMLLFGLGQAPGDIFDQSSSASMTIIFFTIYYFFIVFFLITVFAGIYIDSYRTVVMQSGYGLAQEDSGFRAFLDWLLPDIARNYLLKKFAKLKAWHLAKKQRALEEKEKKRQQAKEARKKKKIEEKKAKELEMAQKRLEGQREAEEAAKAYESPEIENNDDEGEGEPEDDDDRPIPEEESPDRMNANGGHQNDVRPSSIKLDLRLV